MASGRTRRNRSVFIGHSFTQIPQPVQAPSAGTGWVISAVMTIASSGHTSVQMPQPTQPG